MMGTYHMAVIRRPNVLLVVFACCFAASSLNPRECMSGVYYVDAMHPNAVDGPKAQNTYGTPWQSISHAAQQVSDNDTVYVKSSWYFNEQITLEGLQFVTFIGYSDPNEIGDFDDLEAGEGVPTSYDDFMSQNQLTPMPVIFGSNRTVGTAVKIVNCDGVCFRNFQVYQYQVGIELLYCICCDVRNVVVHSLGDVNDDFDGYGVRVTASIGCIVDNSLVLNAAAVAFRLGNTELSLIENCQAYTDDNSTQKKSATDYYFEIINGMDNDIEYCHAERRIGPAGEPAHIGHGYVISASLYFGQESFDNTVSDCTAFNIGEPFVLRGGGAHGNQFSKCQSEGTYESTDNCITISHGPYNNRISRIWLNNSKIALAFFGDNIEPTAGNPEIFGDPFAESASDGNIVENCVFESCAIGAWLSHYSDFDPEDQTVVNNSIINCTFVSSGEGISGQSLSTLLLKNRLGSGNTFVNCIFQGFEQYDGSVWGNTTYSHGFSFDHCCFDVTGDFSSAINSGPGNFQGDPRFAENTFFELVGTLGNPSPCVDTGTTVPVPYTQDYDGSSRPQRSGFDIGAQEVPD